MKWMLLKLLITTVLCMLSHTGCFKKTWYFGLDAISIFVYSSTSSIFTTINRSLQKKPHLHHLLRFHVFKSFPIFFWPVFIFLFTIFSNRNLGKLIKILWNPHFCSILVFSKIWNEDWKYTEFSRIFSFLEKHNLFKTTSSYWNLALLSRCCSFELENRDVRKFTSLMLSSISLFFIFTAPNIKLMCQF